MPGKASPTPEATAPSRASIEQRLVAMERGVAPRPPGWSWILVGLGLLLALGLAAHAIGAYATISRIDHNSGIPSENVVVLFDNLASTGPQVPSSVESSSRGAYSQAVVQYLLDGTGVCLGVAMAFAGVFIRVNG